MRTTTENNKQELVMTNHEHGTTNRPVRVANEAVAGRYVTGVLVRQSPHVIELNFTVPDPNVVPLSMSIPL